MEKIIVMLAAIAGYLVCSVLEDFGYIESKSKLWHWADGAGRTVIFSYASYTVFGFTFFAAVVTTDILVAWWIFFDIALNLKRGDTPFYVGSGTIDLTVKWIAKKCGVNWEILMFSFKLLAFVCMVILTGIVL
jgi:hypothetical protein